MEPDRDWHIARKDDDWDLKDAGMGILRFALLFGLCAAALAVLAVPTLQKRSQAWMGDGPRGVDPISVGSIARPDTYTVRRSVLQPPGTVCIIRRDGPRDSGC